MLIALAQHQRNVFDDLAEAVEAAGGATSNGDGLFQGYVFQSQADSGIAVAVALRLASAA